MTGTFLRGDSPWVSFTGQFGREVVIKRDKILALHFQQENYICRTAGFEYSGPTVFIEYAPTCGEDGTGVTVRGSMQAVMEKLA